MFRLAIVAVSLLAAGCAATPADAVGVTSPGGAPTGSRSPQVGAVEFLQGVVVSVDVASGGLRVRAYLAGAVPREAHGVRQLTIDGHTRFLPAGAGLATVHPGDNVLVQATGGPSGLHALEVMVVDVD